MFAPAVRKSRAFTLVELIVIIVVLAILSGVAIPKYIDYTTSAKSSAAKATIGAVRSAIANFYANSAVTGTVGWPTLVQLQTVGSVMQEVLPNNPYNPGFPRWELTFWYHDAAFDRRNAGVFARRDTEVRRVQWVKAKRTPCGSVLTAA